jgi:hypothetical protein
LSSHDSADTATRSCPASGASDALAGGAALAEDEGVDDALGDSVAEDGAAGGAGSVELLELHAVRAANRTGKVTASFTRLTVITSVKRGAGVQGFTSGQTNS